MAVTAIRSIRNRVTGGAEYHVRNQENPNDTGGRGHDLTVRSGQVIQCNMWIPWCVSQNDFDNHHKILIVPTAFQTIPAFFSIWQQGDYVRYSRDGLFHANGDLVPGNSTAGGDRSVDIVGTTIEDADLVFH
jgi:hypothetical protein